MNTWYKHLGYLENPFVLNPFKERSSLIGQEEILNDSLYFIESGSIVFIEGKSGSGKTKFLRELMKSFQGRVIYVNAAKLTKTLNIEDLLRGKNGLAGKLFGSKPKDMILFLDNIDELSVVNLERLKYYFDQGYLQSVVCSGQKFDKVGFPPSLAQRIGSRIFKLNSLNEDQAVQLALNRLDENIDAQEPLIETKHLKEIFSKAKKNPKTYLMYLHQVFSQMAEDDETNVTEEHLKVLEQKVDTKELDDVLESDKATEQEQTRDGKIMKVGEYYRNPDSEIFCGNCGAIVSETDTVCPECQASFEEVELEADKKGEANA